MSIGLIIFKILGVACCVGLFLLGMMENSLNPLELVGILILFCGVLSLQDVDSKNDKEGDK